MDYPHVSARSPQNAFLEGPGLAESRNKNNGVERQPRYGVSGTVFDGLIQNKKHGVLKWKNKNLSRKRSRT